MNIVIDYALVDGNGLPRWVDLLKACDRAGSRFAGVIFRGAFGTDPDPTVRRDWESAQHAGLTTGAYLFLRDRQNQPVVDQVHAFADNVGTLTANDFVPIIDVEDTWPSAEAELEALHVAWRAMKDIYGVPPMLYDSNRVWTEDLHNLPAAEMLASPQWVAKPWPLHPRSPALLSPKPFALGRYEPIVPAPWGATNWWLHQYQGDALPVPGFTDTVDLSRFHLMREGTTGPRAAWVLRRLGWGIQTVFDAAMVGRLRAYQAAHGLVADGIIGLKTFTRICWTPLPSA